MRLAVVLLAFCSLAQAADPKALGRLFHTPEERRALDQERNAAGDGGRKDGQLTVNGVIYRSNGETTVWINQQMQHHEQHAAPRPSGRIRMADGQSLQVGETAGKGKVEDLLEPGAIRVIPPAP